jgi:biopolymer transport protein ExbD
MASISVSGARGARRVDHDLPLVPFIDFLLCLIAFLLVTAAWSHAARLAADAKVPGAPSSRSQQQKELHVTLGEHDFELAWKQGATVLESSRVPRRAESKADGSLRYPELGPAIGATFRAHADHRSSDDRVRERAVLHTGNTADFDEIVATMDQIMMVERKLEGAPANTRHPAFAVSFAVD